MELKKNQIWKSLPADMTRYNHKFEVGKWYKANGKIKACSNGFHGSKRIIDAMQYVNLEVLALCEVKGKSDKRENDKEAWENIKIIKAWHWTKEDSLALAIFAAELVIDNYEKEYPNDKRPRESIEAARRYLQKPTEAARAAGAARAAAEAARAAAGAAARAAGAAEAARAAAGAARAAAEAAEAAWAAAGAAGAAWAAAGAARAAAGAAEAAAGAAARDSILYQCETFIQSRINSLKPYDI